MLHRCPLLARHAQDAHLFTEALAAVHVGLAGVMVTGDQAAEVRIAGVLAALLVDAQGVEIDRGRGPSHIGIEGDALALAGAHAGALVLHDHTFGPGHLR